MFSNIDTKKINHLDTKKINHRTYDFNLSDLIDNINEGSLYLSEVQRLFVWSENVQSALIDSILHNYYIPPIQLWKISHQTRDFYVNDGQQRLITILKYTNNSFPYKPEDSNLMIFYNEVPNKYKNRINVRILTEMEKFKFEEYRIPVVEFSPVNNKNIMTEYFKRVNSNSNFKQTDWIGISMNTFFFTTFIPEIFHIVPNTFFETLKIGDFNNYSNLYTDKDVELKKHAERDNDGRNALLKLIPYVVASLNSKYINYKYASSASKPLLPYYDIEIPDNTITTCADKISKLEAIFRRSNCNNSTSNITDYTHIPCVILYDINTHYAYAHNNMEQNENNEIGDWWPEEKNLYWINIINHYIGNGNYISEIEGAENNKKKRTPELICTFRDKINAIFIN